MLDVTSKKIQYFNTTFNKIHYHATKGYSTNSVILNSNTNTNINLASHDDACALSNGQCYCISSTLTQLP
jgi:alpha-D-ribose 1-methylphosphonate 5-triphosphate diphosphatase PhnM